MSGQKRLVIVGNSEIACMAYEYFTHDSDYEVAGFAIGKDFVQDSTFCGLPVNEIEEITSVYPPDQFDAFVAIGDSKLNRVRREYFDLCKSKGYKLASFVSSDAFVWRNVKVGENCFIFEANILQPFVEVGDNTIIWSGNHIGHRTIIEEDVFIASQVVISGYCRIGRWSFLGVNVAVANNVTIGADNFIGMGANITRNTPDNTMWRAPPSMSRDIPARKFFKVGE